MTERRGRSLRRTGMRATAVGSVVFLGLVLAGCGDDEPDPASVGTAPATACPSNRDATVVVARADLDGHGARETIGYQPSTAHCGAYLVATVDGRTSTTPLDDDLPVRSASSFAISVPGHVGDLAVLRQEHPRGGFQIVLVAWSAGAGLSTLDVDDHPVFPFVATDTESTPLTARCVEGGVEITQARRHAPIGVVPAWDVERTTYVVNGTSTTASPAQEVADNVLEQQLRAKYADLVHHRLFENCRVGS
jgi:hypothetical protein